PEPAGFTGKEADEEVGLVYFGERYLIPRIGRWASPDPLAVHALGGGEAMNSYHYVSGNLLQARDPLGLGERWEAFKGYLKDVPRNLKGFDRGSRRGAINALKESANGLIQLGKDTYEADRELLSDPQGTLSAIYHGLAEDLHLEKNRAEETVRTIVDPEKRHAAIEKAKEEIIDIPERLERMALRIEPEEAAEMVGEVCGRVEVSILVEVALAEVGAKSVGEYLEMAREVAKDGTRISYLYKGEQRFGFVKFMGNTSKGDAKFAFVGTNAEGSVTTFHVESGKDFWKLLNGNPADKTIRLEEDALSARAAWSVGRRDRKRRHRQRQRRRCTAISTEAIAEVPIRRARTAPSA
ncbi:MAG: RHS repeat-associated core domain-containing protein, partial [Pseudomonadota bacterium]